MVGRVLPLVFGLGLLVFLSACGAAAPNVAVAQANPSDTPVWLSDASTAPVTPGSSSLFNRDQSAPTMATMRVLWRIKSYVFPSGFSGNKDAAQTMLFKPLDITDASIIFDGRACDGVTFQRETLSAADFLSGSWHIDPQALDITGQQLEHVKTDCSLPGFQEYVRLNDGRLIVPIDGVFYIFEPVRNY